MSERARQCNDQVVAVFLWLEKRSACRREPRCKTRNGLPETVKHTVKLNPIHALRGPSTCSLLHITTAVWKTLKSACRAGQDSQPLRPCFRSVRTQACMQPKMSPVSLRSISRMWHSTNQMHHAADGFFVVRFVAKSVQSASPHAFAPIVLPDRHYVTHHAAVNSSVTSPACLHAGLFTPRNAPFSAEVFKYVMDCLDLMKLLP